MNFTTNSKEEMQKIASDFLSNISPKENSAVVVGLYGNLGAGKTTFTQYIAKSLGLEESIVSPTFVIEKIYELADQKFSHLIHIDAYRLDSSQELLSLGWKEIISNPKNLILIEWPEKVEDIMPEHIKVQIKHGEKEDSRDIEMEF